MATRTAQNSGNWSAASTWDTPPTAGDTVELGGYNVTVDVDIDIGGGTIQNTAGGTLTLPAGTIASITANINQVGASQILAPSSTSVITLNGNATNRVANRNAVYNVGGILVVNGDCVNTEDATGGKAIYGRIGGSVTVNGAVSNAAPTGYALYDDGGCDITVTGAVTNTATTGWAISTTGGSGRIEVGSVSAAGCQGIQFSGTSSGSVRVRGTASGSISCTGGSLQIDGDAAMDAVSISRTTLLTLGDFTSSSFSSANNAVWYYRDGSTLPGSPGICFPIPKPADVRLSSTSYFGAYTGTLDVAAAEAAAAAAQLEADQAAVTAAAENIDGSVSILGIEGTGMNAQTLARETYGTSGTVWHVAVDGNDAHDGLSWAAAKLSPKTVIEAASAGDLVPLGAGTFALENAGIHVPADVSLCGAGSQRTILTSASTYDTSPILCPGDRSRISNILIRGVGAAGTTQYPISDSLGACADVVLEDVEIDCDSDGLMFASINSSVLMRNSTIRTKYDAIFCQHARLDVFDSTLLVNGPSTTSSGDIAHGVNLLAASGRVRLFNSRIDVHDANATTQGVHASFGTLELHGCSIYASSATGDVRAIVQEGAATILAVGCEYDRSKTSGVVTDIARVVTDTAGNARAVVDGLGALSPEERQAIADALLDRADGVETGATPRQAMRIMAAILAGQVTGAGSGTERFCGLDGVTPRVEVVADASGNRSSVSYSPD